MADSSDWSGSEKMDTLLYALGSLFWFVAKDMKARGDLSEEDKFNMIQTANYLRVMSGKTPPFFEL